ncbi:hypothetical protein M8C21_024774, partial [Ambrosia artemisiifolia]
SLCSQAIGNPIRSLRSFELLLWFVRSDLDICSLRKPLSTNIMLLGPTPALLRIRVLLQKSISQATKLKIYPFNFIHVLFMRLQQIVSSNSMLQDHVTFRCLGHNYFASLI